MTYCVYCTRYFEYDKNWTNHMIAKHGTNKMWYDCKLLTVRQVYGKNGILNRNKEIEN